MSVKGPHFRFLSKFVSKGSPSIFWALDIAPTWDVPVLLHLPMLFREIQRFYSLAIQ